MVRRAIFLVVALAACDWRTFDDLSSQTWVHSQQTPSGVGSTNYALGIAPVEGSPRPGALAVLGNDEPTYSVLAFDASGGTTVAGSPVRLGQQSFTSLAPQPVFVAGAQQQVAAAAATMVNGTTPAIAVVYGAAETPKFTTVPVAAGQPDDPGAATFAGSTLVIAAGMQLYQVDTTAAMPVPVSCSLVDPLTTGPDAIAALASDGTNVYAWMQSGALLALPQALGTSCAATATVATTAGFTPGAGAKLLLSPGSHYAVLAASDASGKGAVFVVDLLATGATATAGLAPGGVAAAALGALGPAPAMTYLALGFPDRAVSGAKAGQVELYAFDPATGTLAGAPDEVLHDAQPSSGQEFGRDVAVMPFGGAGILVVAAKGEVFAYYETTLYADTRTRTP